MFALKANIEVIGFVNFFDLFGDKSKASWQLNVYSVFKYLIFVLYLALNYFNKTPDIPVSLSQVTELRNFYRKNVAEAGGILKVEVIELKGLPAIECLFKMPMQPSGMLYLASFTIPFREKSYVVKTQCPEQGTTDARDSAVLRFTLTSTMRTMKTLIHSKVGWKTRMMKL